MGPFLLGFALLAMLDVIVLHLMLGWHHLVSGRTSDMRTLLVVDGGLLLVAWGLLAIGIWRLWRAPVAARPLWSGLLLGGGTFHIMDSVLSHWVLRLHHIHPGAPMVADGVVLGSGIVLLAAGWWLRS